ncbi:MAG TPA: TlpA disulfide reductase family protein [Thermoanaerobaculia bacterium]|nr:TlpA disulfide reductase family protein [Thermoanaerobaculia bacterium]
MTPAALALLFAAARAAGSPRPVVPVRPEQYASTVVAPHRGRVLLVNFWATWCEPCREELPSLVAAWKESGRAFDVVLVSADSRKLKDGVVPAVLSDLGVPFPCYIEDSADPQRFIDTVDPKWEGELPHTIVYGGDGKPAGTAAGRRTKEQFRSMAAAAAR